MRSDLHPTEADLARWSFDNPGFRFERIAGEILVSPTGGKSGRRNHRLNEILGAWAREHGFEAFGPSTGFVFGTLTVSPDEALLRAGRFEALSDDDQERFVPIAPDIVVELVSQSQGYGKSRRGVYPKCEAMHAAGVAFVMLLDPYAEAQSERIIQWGTPPPDFPTNWDAVLSA